MAVTQVKVIIQTNDGTGYNTFRTIERHYYGTNFNQSVFDSLATNLDEFFKSKLLDKNYFESKPELNTSYQVPAQVPVKVPVYAAVENPNEKLLQISNELDENEIEKFKQESLYWHNKYRAKHGANPLRLCPKLSKCATDWAKKLAKNDKVQHRPENLFGENIFMSWSTDPKFQVKGCDAVNKWYSEIQYYNFKTGQSFGPSGHLTQLLWKSSKELGIGQAKSATGKVYIVANYYPPGNIIGEYVTNVLPKK